MVKPRATSRAAKYKAKAAIDTFFMRAGDVLQGRDHLCRTQLSFGLSDFAAVNVVLTLVWLGIALCIYREHRRRSLLKPSRTKLGPGVFILRQVIQKHPV
jgi:hypothetical protein